jgi:dihydrolipoamide dehydrogenase
VVFDLKEYDLITIGTGSAMAVVNAIMQDNPDIKVAVVDKDEPGGICLTRGCIPSKILLYPAELIRNVERTGMFGIDVEMKRIDFVKVMDRMRELIGREINMIREGLSHSKNLDYYPGTAEFVAPYTLKVGDETVKSNMIFLCTGSKPLIPQVEGLENTGYLTSDTILKLNLLPKSIAIIGGGYISAEYGHFFSSMGAEVTIVGRNPAFLPDEEPEVSALVKKELQKHMRVITNHEVREISRVSENGKKVVAVNRETGEKVEIIAEEILVAAGRGSNTDILHPERGGIKTDEHGWILVNEFLETTQPGVWAFGDADGRFQFKHVANYEAQIVYYNAVQKRGVKVDYHAVPHAVFTYPEVASVGLGEKEAIAKYGVDRVLIGIERYEDTAKGEAMGVKDYFCKVIVERATLRILGAHIVGPYASVLVQEIVDSMYTHEQNALFIMHGMHIHPALSEVVAKAFASLMTPEQYHHVMEEHFGLLSI